MSKLNEDILFLLFKELQDDSKSLFSCLMVNKVWCETIIPILWNNPWRYDLNYKKSSLYHIINFYLVNDTKVKEFLTRQKIQLPQISHKSLLFDYLSFCKSINVSIINSIISFGFSFSSGYSKFLLKQEFYNILIRKCSELKYLDMRSIEHQIFYFPEAKVRLDSLYELKCDTSIDPSFFYGLACICQNIQRLMIDNTSSTKENYGIIKLIEVQSNLKYFEWNDSFDDSDLDCYDYFNYEESFCALVQKADTLNHLIISFQYIEDYEHVFLKEVLPKLHKLKTLKIYDFYLLRSDEILKTLVYRDLEVININCITTEAAACIIENSRGCLKEILFLPEHDGYNFDYSLIIIRKIYENCPLIEYLSFVFPSLEEYFTEFKKLLKVCQNLKSLLLLVEEETDKSYKNGENLLEILVESAPTNLRELKFDFKVSLEALETFLEKWKGRTALSMFTDNSVYIKEDYKNLITKYKRVGVIKDFRYVYNIYHDST